MNQPPLNPDGIEAAAKAIFDVRDDEFDMDEWEDLDSAEKERYVCDARAAVSAYLAVAQPVVNSIPGVYDLGSPEPEGVDQVEECDELGHPCKRAWDDNNDYTWSKTIDDTRWKGYKNGKEYVEWPELVRRYGPVKAVTPEGGGE